jgi:acyl-CoA thioester hydrolase
VELVYRGSVNRWECDENDHLNVRFYVQRHWQSLSAGLHRAGIQIGDAELLTHLKRQHLRFIAESRIAAPMSGYMGVVAVDDNGIDVLTVLRHSFSDEPLGTCLHRIAGIDAQVNAELPDYGAPRGIADLDSAYAGIHLRDCADLGFKAIGMGLIQTEECTLDGLLLNHHYMGRLSDSMPHLWGMLFKEIAEPNPNEGGAVLEYRLRHHQPMRAGMPFVIQSGIAEVGAKVQRFVHLLFNADTGQVALSAEAVGVRMDLAARRAMTLEKTRLERMRALTIRPMK